ncbi:MAG: septal ring lytic transglycosylase RlpA family protein [Hyphomicrobiaceae bacterium]
MSVSRRNLGRSGFAGSLPALACVVAALLAVGCSGGGRVTSNDGFSSERRTGVAASPRVVADGRPVPKGGGVYKLGSPYKVAGRWYVPREEPGYDRTGLASWYGADFHGRRTANGEIYDRHALTAAHPTLPLPSYAYVTNLENGRTVLVRINDRGPYAHDRVLDLSQTAARLLDTERRGVAKVRVRYAGRAPLDGNDAHERRFLAAQSWHRSGYADTRPAVGWGARWGLGLRP